MLGFFLLLLLLLLCISPFVQCTGMACSVGQSSAAVHSFDERELFFF